MRFGFLLLLMPVFLVACKRDKTPEQESAVHTNSINVHVNFNGVPFQMDSVYTFIDGTKIQFSTLKFYVNNVKSGNLLLKEYALFDWSLNPTKLISEAGDLPVSNQLLFNIGVPSSVNHNDPSLWPTNHPLNIMVANDMHWDWNPGYIFLKIEAKADTILDGITNLDHLLTYHIGMDANFLPITLTGANWQSVGNVSTLNLSLDLNKVFNTSTNPIDVKTESTTHSAPGQEVLTTKVLNNFAGALTLE